MSDIHQPQTRRQRRVAERESASGAAQDRRNAGRAARASGQGRTIRTLVFGGIVVGVLGVGATLAFGDFLDRPSGAIQAGVIDVQSSMAGFSPNEIRTKAGETVTLNWWTDDAALHLEGGVHTMVSDELGLYEELPAESTRLVTWTAPDKPGTYDVWCDSCCGGKDSPSMHGTIVIEPASASARGEVLG